MDREALRKDLEALQVLTLSSGSAHFLQSVSHLSENYWVLRVLAELRAGQPVEEILSQLDDAQGEIVHLAIKQSFHLIMEILMICCAIADVAAQVQSSSDGTDLQ